VRFDSSVKSTSSARAAGIASQRHRRDAPAGKDVPGVVEPAVGGLWRADAEARAVGAVGGEAGKFRRDVGLEGRAQHQVLGLVAGQEHLGQRHEVGAGVAPRPPRREGLVGIVAQRAHGGVELCQCQAERVGHGRPFAILRGYIAVWRAVERRSRRTPGNEHA